MDFHRPRGWLLLARDHAQQGGLPRAIGSNDAEHVTHAQVHVEVLEEGTALGDGAQILLCI